MTHSVRSVSGTRMACARAVLACAAVLAIVAPALTAEPPPRTPWRAGEWLRQWRPGVPESEALRMVRKPTEDAARFDRVWNELVLPLKDAYEMNP